MKSEDTVYDENVQGTNEDILCEPENMNSSEKAEAETTVGPVEKNLKGSWHTVVIGSVTGLIFGAAATALANGLGGNGQNPVSPTNSDVPVKPTNNTNGHQNNPLIVDNNISIATCVDDRMSFSEAFAAARAEVGSGGVFEWHGNLYNTYTAEEWNSMSAEQKADYNEHFAWANHESHDLSNQHLAQHEDASNGHEDAIEVHVVSQNGHPHDTDLAENGTDTAEHEEIVDADDVQVEVLGVVHDDNSDMNYGSLSIDGQQAVVVDVDGDLVFDSLVVDVNADGEVQENEVADISEEHLSVNAMGGFTDLGAGNLMASTDEPNYVDDVDYEA